MTDWLALGFFRDALWASLLIGLTLSVMGVYVVLRRIVFVGAGLAQVSAAGVALGTVVGVIHPDGMALVATLVGVALLSLRPRRVTMPSEGAIGIGYALASTLAILLVARAPGGESDSLLLLYGNILAVPPYHITLLAISCPLLLALHLLFRKEFMMVSYSPITAQAAGVGVRRWNLLLYVTLGIGISSGIHVAGSLLTFSYLVLPSLAAIMIAGRAWQVGFFAAIFALTGSVAGLYGSVIWDLPTGPSIVAALVAETGIAWVVARLRP